MRVSLQWLKDYVPVRLPAADFAHKLSMAGNDVETMHRIGGDWDGIRVAEVVALEKHPNADRLQLVTVDLGESRLTIVSGAPNLAVGQRVPFAPVGTKLIDGHTGEMSVLKPSKIRGVESAGMVCSALELGLGDDHTGILVLEGSTPVGQPISDLFGDTVLDIKTTPNRPDTLSMVGVAREAAAITGESLTEPPLDYEEHQPSIDGKVTVTIEDPDVCARYSAALIRGVTIGPSPVWMQERLLAAGMRPINNVVDITNYVMLETGQPLHAFDAATIPNGHIIVRRAKAGEKLTTLDNTARELDPSMLLITSETGPIALAGVMGGLDTEVTPATRDILLESASFDGITIRRTAAALRLRSEASNRFEKGVSAAMTEIGLRRAVRLLSELAGGKAAAGIVDEYPGRKEQAALSISVGDVERILGIRWPVDKITGAFTSLGFKVVNVNGESLLVTPPYWRTDIELIENLVEEVARIVGYDELPATSLRGAIPATPVEPAMIAIERAREILTGAGLQEIITYPLVSRELNSRAGAVPEPLALLNPMSAEQEILRTTLRPSILKTLAENLKHEDRVAIFEVGTIYLPREGDLPDERKLVAGAIAGPREDRSWHTAPAEIDFYTGKGVLELLCGRLRLDATYEPSSDELYQPGRAATVKLANGPAGTVGEVHSRVADAFDIRETVVYFEVELNALIANAEPRYQVFSKFPAVTQDIAVIVDSDVNVEKIRSALQGGRFVQSVTLFDVYTGKSLPEGKRSLAFSLRFQAMDRTLTEDEVSRIRDGLVERLRRQFGAEHRK